MRSTSVEISTAPGIHCFSSGINALTRSTVSMTLASPCLVIWISTAGCLLNQAIDRLLRTESSTSATSESRTKLPFELLIRMSRNSAAVRICRLTDKVSLWRPPLKMPTGPSGLALMIASLTSSVAMPALESATGLSAIRTAGWSAPLTVTSPTPGTCEMRCAITGIRDVIDRAWRYRLRRQRQHEYRRRRGIGFAEARQARQVARQIGERGVDRGLHVARGPIDVAADGELQLDAGRTQRACGGDLVESRDLAKLAFQRRGNGRRHHRRVGARTRREHADHRKVDIGHRGNRQKLRRRPRRPEKPDRQQRGADRPADEGLRDRCHYCIPSVAPATGGDGSSGPTGGTAFSIRRFSRSSAR